MMYHTLHLTHLQLLTFVDRCNTGFCFCLLFILIEQYYRDTTIKSTFFFRTNFLNLLISFPDFFPDLFENHFFLFSDALIITQASLPALVPLLMVLSSLSVVSQVHTWMIIATGKPLFLFFFTTVPMIFSLTIWFCVFEFQRCHSDDNPAPKKMWKLIC